MTLPQGLTLKRVRDARNLVDSDFLELYERLFVGKLKKRERLRLLRFALIFLNSDEKALQRLGYRIVLQYSLRYEDYRPLYDVAFELDYMPIVNALEEKDPRLRGSAFSSSLRAAHMSNFIVESDGGQTIRSRGQMELRDFAARNASAVVVAPTSYGKSEMLLERVLDATGQRICILVPTRALIAQTSRLLVSDSRFRETRMKLITHPEGYLGQDAFVAVLTQERLQRLFVQFSELQLQTLLIDEAHNMMPSGARAEQLVQTLLIAENRNASMNVQYFTPFVAEAKSLETIYERTELVSNKMDESIKVELLHYTNQAGQMFVYDQFLDESFLTQTPAYGDERELIRNLGGPKNLIYANKPKEVQDFAIRLANTNPVNDSMSAQVAARAIGELVDPDYALTTCVQRGVLFHHAHVPDILRQYVERLFSETEESDGISYLVTNSTLLEGVNTPADTLFLITPGHGQGYLKPSSFRNLIGRAGRFKEIFSVNAPRLELLQPRIYLLHTALMRSTFSGAAYLKKVSDASRLVVDEVKNPLLANGLDSPRRRELLEQLENVEPGSTRLEAPRRALTQIGSLCFKNSVTELRILENEGQLDRNLQEFRDFNSQLSEIDQVVPAICAIFLSGVELVPEQAQRDTPLSRLQQYEAARQFYGRFLGWRANNSPMKAIVASYLAYWAGLPDQLVYVGRKWGEQKRRDTDFVPTYVWMQTKNRAQRVTLAVAKIKEEHDFVDFELLKFVEVMNELQLMSENLYLQIKYATTDKTLICLLRNGVSRELSRALIATYSEHFSIDFDADEVVAEATLLSAMSDNDENLILQYEAEILVGVTSAV